MIAVMERLMSCLPESCLLVLGATGGVVGTPVSCISGGYGNPMELERGEGISGLFLPYQQLQGVRIKPFLVTEAHVRTQNHPDDWYASDEFKSLVGLPVGADTLDVKCVLWFVITELEDQDYSDVFASEVVDDFVASCGAHRFALGGAVLDRLLSANATGLAKEDTFVCAGFCFSGDTVRSASTILPPSVRGARAVERQLRRLRRNSGFESWDVTGTVGFMFACVARGARLHGRSSVEADAFARVFPGVPLMGLFGNGEIGTEYVQLSPDRQVATAMTKGNKIQSCMHGYTTVFVLLSLGGTK